jgi:hypothetical protein
VTQTLRFEFGQQIDFTHNGTRGAVEMAVLVVGRRWNGWTVGGG